MTDSFSARINAAYHKDETAVLEHLIDQCTFSAAQRERIESHATSLVQTVRAQAKRKSGIEGFLQEYKLSSQEGVALMTLAESLMRIPDAHTANLLIKDKIGGANWRKHLANSEGLISASTWALLLTGKVVGKEEKPLASIRGLVARLGEPVVRTALVQAMKLLGRQFVMGATMAQALKRAIDFEKQGYLFSYDMLGEAARTADDAQKYFEAYEKAIAAIGVHARGRGVERAPGISVKLSALHPRYEYAQRERCVPVLADRLLQLARQCAAHDISLTVDAEEANRLEISLEVFEHVFAAPDLGAWQGMGLAVQAYQKRSYDVVDYLIKLAQRKDRKMMIRLVKGAYWDSEIKYAQMGGFESYPVFTRKAATDVSYLACAQKLLAHRDHVYPMFATHNAHTLSAIVEMADQDRTGFEFQRLHGMGESLYDQMISTYPCRIYAPVGDHQDLLPYLVRRLLENGANSSFVNRLQDSSVPLADIIADPIEKIRATGLTPHPKIPMPRDLYGPDRKNAKGIEFANPLTSDPLLAAIEGFRHYHWRAAPMIDGKSFSGELRSVYAPADRRKDIGQVAYATSTLMEQALRTTHAARKDWNATSPHIRAACLEKAADLLEENMAEMMALCVFEGGKTLPDAQAEVREAIDFCRYYAREGVALFANPHPLPGPTGEDNQLSYDGRGVFLCISPWNFPLAIFTGQVVAALMAGNCVIAKPADQTCLIAARMVELLYKAGIPENVLCFLPARGRTVGEQLVPDDRIAGVCFTGSTEVAQTINRTLAARTGAIVPLIAETGGQNAMIADTTALPEQIVDDVITSAFRSAGQRCSALRVLYVQEDFADKVIRMLQGACQELVIGDNALLATDIGPVIDDQAVKTLTAHVAALKKSGAPQIVELDIPPGCTQGSFFAPCAFEINSMRVLKREVFGPLLHIVRFKAQELDKVIDEINTSGYGLTFGVHTRLGDRAQKLAQKIEAGNIYVNRSMIGAVVGVQPFGGHGLSGTGPKAGGPFYLPRFATERTVTINTTAAGGNTTLVTLGEE